MQNNALSCNSVLASQLQLPPLAIPALLQQRGIPSLAWQELGEEELRDRATIDSRLRQFRWPSARVDLTVARHRSRTWLGEADTPAELHEMLASATVRAAHQAYLVETPRGPIYSALLVRPALVH